MTTSESKKSDVPSPEHMEWLISSRTANQRSALSLYSLLDTHFDRIKKSVDKSTKAQFLTAACFSLWRAAFLADKTGIRENVLNDARAFLVRMLTDNAITYPQDRASREWTFNYYVGSARVNLMQLSQYWSNVEDKLSEARKIRKGTTAFRRRWDRYQDALDLALNAFREELEAE